MDSFKIELKVREKYLTHLVIFFDVEEDVIKKWSQVGKGLDYYTFKTWLSKDNRYTTSTTKYPKSPINFTHYYHDINSILDKLNANNYEMQLKFYEAISLLCLVDKKKLSNRVSYVKWVEKCLDLDPEDCSIIRENILIDFKLDFNNSELSKLKKEAIFLQGVKLSFISDSLIDNKETLFLKDLSTRLELNVEKHDYSYYINYLNRNILSSDSGLNKAAAFLLHFIGCDEEIHESEIRWFRDFFGPVDMKEVRPLLNTDKTKLLSSLDDRFLCLTYLLALEVSLADEEIHANERFWLEEIQTLFRPDYEVCEDLYCIFLNIANNHLSFVNNYPSFFSFIGNRAKFDTRRVFKNWTLSQALVGKKVNTKALSMSLYGDQYTIDDSDKVEFLINFSSTIIGFKNNLNIVENFKLLSSHIFKNKLEDYYSELLICELLKISLIDDNIEECEDNFLRALQYKFNIDERCITRVIFYTSFLLGREIKLSERINYSQI
jgi:hypothetical protein